MVRRAFVFALALALGARFAAPLPALAASADQSIDGGHVSHLAWEDMRPLCPVDHQAFAVRLYALQHDLTGVRVRFHDATGSWVPASVVGQRGPYDIWEASLPAATRDTVSYYFELSDGATRDFWGPAGFASTPPADSGYVVDFATLSHAPIGTTPVPGGMVFKVWAPSSNETWVQGDFNGYGMTDELAKVGDYFIGRVNGAHSGQRYEFLFDGGVPNFDARSRAYEPVTGYTHSRLDDPSAFTWTSNDFDTPPLGQMVVYQLNVGTFCGLNDPDGSTPFPSGFADVAARVHHLAELGVNAVMLNPVTSSPNLTYAGYECISPWPPNALYGTPSQLKLLIDTCHHYGIAVLCDIVWNHVPPSANYLWNYNGLQLYFSDPPTMTQWGPQADFSIPEVADYYEQSALHWLEEYRVDGFRMDAVAAMAIGNKPWAGWALMQRFNADLERRWMDKVRIAEEFPVTAQVTNPASVGGAGFDAQYNGDDVFYLKNAAYSARFGYTYGDWALINAVSKPGPLTEQHQAFDYFELHDNAWTPNHRFILDLQRVPGAPDDTAAACMRVMTAGLMLGPGVPAMLMGDEWLEQNAWGTTVANRIDWSNRTTNAKYWQWTHDLVRLRTHLPAFYADSPSQVLHDDYDNNVVSWMRHDDQGNVFLVVANLGPYDFPLYQLGAPLAGTWAQELDSQAPDYGGTDPGNAPLATVPTPWDGMPQSLIMRLQHSSVIVLRAIPTTSAPHAPVAGGTRLDAVFPSPLRGGEATVAFTLARDADVRLDVYDARGARVARIANGPAAAGAHLLRWNARDDSGQAVAPGVYFVHLDAAGVRSTRRLAVLR